MWIVFILVTLLLNSLNTHLTAFYLISLCIDNNSSKFSQSARLVLMSLYPRARFEANSLQLLSVQDKVDTSAAYGGSQSEMLILILQKNKIVTVFSCFHMNHVTCNLKAVWTFACMCAGNRIFLLGNDKQMCYKGKNKTDGCHWNGRHAELTVGSDSVHCYHAWITFNAE